MKLNSRREGVVRVFVKTTSLHCRLLTIMCLCILLTATQRSASGGISRAVADTHTEQTTEYNTVHGTGNYNSIQNQFGDLVYVPWVKFDLSARDPGGGVNPEVTYALLSIWLKSSSDFGDTSFRLFGMNDNWDEDISGATAPGFDGWIKEVDFDSSHVGEFIRIDVDILDYVVRGMNDYEDYIVSLALVPNLMDDPQIRANMVSHRALGDPYLEDYISIMTVVNPEPATLGILGVGGLLMLRRRRLN